MSCDRDKELDTMSGGEDLSSSIQFRCPATSQFLFRCSLQSSSQRTKGQWLPLQPLRSPIKLCTSFPKSSYFLFPYSTFAKKRPFLNTNRRVDSDSVTDSETGKLTISHLSSLIFSLVLVFVFVSFLARRQDRDLSPFRTSIGCSTC